MKGQIVRIISNLFTVKIDNNLYECRARGKFRNDKETPVVGDYCEVDIKNNYIIKLFPRKNVLKRPVIANIDMAVIVTSVKKPDLSLNLMDKLLINIIYNNIEPIICFTKLDLLNKEELSNLEIIVDYYQKLGIKVFNNKEIEKLKKVLKNKIVVLTGQTGAGKSSLLNKFDSRLNLKTSSISEALGRGVHTTRHVELFNINNILIADTPGFSSLSFENMSTDDIKKNFIEFNNYDCKYKDCSHINEQECNIKNAVVNNEIMKSRYDNYVKFINEVKK
jgi:ribosome biogenesis GTPase / thiamine phosphate phosphatase